MACGCRVLNIFAIPCYLQQSCYWKIREKCVFLLLLLIGLEYPVTLNLTPVKVFFFSCVTGSLCTTFGDLGMFSEAPLGISR